MEEWKALGAEAGRPGLRSSLGSKRAWPAGEVSEDQPVHW